VCPEVARVKRQDKNLKLNKLLPAVETWGPDLGRRGTYLHSDRGGEEGVPTVVAEASKERKRRTLSAGEKGNSWGGGE